MVDYSAKPILIIGDSMVRGLTNICHADIVPLPGAKVQDLLRFLERDGAPIPTASYHSIVVWVGTNHFGESVEQTKEAFIPLLRYLKNQCPSVHIALQSVLPRPRDDDRSRDWVKQLNRWLAGACKRNHFKFFKITSLFLSRDGFLHVALFRDGLHLTTRGLNKVRDSLKTRITRWSYGH